MKIRRWGSFILLCIVFLSCTACNHTMASEDSEKEKLIIWAWDEYFNIKAANEAKKIFMESNPNIEVEVVTMTQDEVISKLNIALSSGDYMGLPNIVLIEDYRIQKYLKEVLLDAEQLRAGSHQGPPILVGIHTRQ